MKSKRIIMALLIIVAVVSIGVAISYPIRYKMELDSNNSELEDLSSMRRRVMEEQHIDTAGETDSQPAQPPEEMPVVRDVPIDGAQPDGQTRDEAPAAVTPEQTAGTADAADRSRQDAQIQTGAADSMPASAPQTPGEAAEGVEIQTGTADSMPATAPDQSAETGDTSTPTLAQDDGTGGMTGPVVVQDDGTGELTGPVIVQDDGTGGTETQAPGAIAGPTRTPGIMDLIIDDVIIRTPTPAASSTPVPVTPSPSPTPDRKLRDDADTYKGKDKVQLDESKILPELKDIYALNHDLVGWLYIEDTNIDYPVVQRRTDRTYYLTHDFYGNTNSNGQIIMEDNCDPYTPSYNLVLSGHHMNSGAMFGRLGLYKDKAYWETHKIVEFDSLMARKRYVVFGAFYSADYDVNEKGFRYSADIQYKMDADMWLGEIKANRIYDTGIETEFGDEFITLTTCDHSRRSNGRFVVVARRIREGEIIQ